MEKPKHGVLISHLSNSRDKGIASNQWRVPVRGEIYPSANFELYETWLLLFIQFTDGLPLKESRTLALPQLVNTMIKRNANKVIRFIAFCLMIEYQF